jgi:hypothetical protein
MSECDTKYLQSLVLISFPVPKYDGPIMQPSNGTIFEAEADDLDRVIGGKRWQELDREYIEANRDDYLLMRPQAVKVYLGAWLWYAVENLDAENVVRDALMHHLRYSSDHLWTGPFNALTNEQVEILRQLARCTLETSRLNIEKENASKALEHIPEVGRGE